MSENGLEWTLEPADALDADPPHVGHQMISLTISVRVKAPEIGLSVGSMGLRLEQDSSGDALGMSGAAHASAGHRNR